MFSHRLSKAASLTLIGICLLIAPLSGCAKPTPPPEPVTISFAYPEWYGEHFETLADEFRESYPHITLELRPVPGTVFVQSFWVGDADAFVSGTWFANLRMMLEQGHIMDLRPFVQTDEALDPQDFYLGEGALLAKEHEIQGVPLGANMAVMYYNQDLFDRYNVAYPDIGWTYRFFRGHPSPARSRCRRVWLCAYKSCRRRSLCLPARRAAL
jgi:ABC-type glycerol-3-phosphate transport system substrate-binding protein